MGIDLDRNTSRVSRMAASTASIPVRSAGALNAPILLRVASLYFQYFAEEGSLISLFQGLVTAPTKDQYRSGSASSNQRAESPMASAVVTMNALRDFEPGSSSAP